MLRTVSLHVLALGLLVGPPAALEAADFQSAWPADANRVWAGRDYWTNPLQDWRLRNGLLECHVAGGDRNVFLLTREIGDRGGDLDVSVTLGRLAGDSGPLGKGLRGLPGRHPRRIRRLPGQRGPGRGTGRGGGRRRAALHRHPRGRLAPGLLPRPPPRPAPAGRAHRSDLPPDAHRHPRGRRERDSHPGGRPLGVADRWDRPRLPLRRDAAHPDARPRCSPASASGGAPPGGGRSASGFTTGGSPARASTLTPSAASARSSTRFTR